MVREEDKATYFLSNKMHEALLGESNSGTRVYKDIISSPLALTITHSDSLIEGCVSWNNVKQKKTTKCQYAMSQ